MVKYFVNVIHYHPEMNVSEVELGPPTLVREPNQCILRHFTKLQLTVIRTK